MCLIVYNPGGLELPMNEIRIAYGNNQDGFGIMWPEDGRVKSVRGLFNFKQIAELIKERKGKPYAFHMRWRTVGAVGVDQCHPFKTLNKDDGDAQDLYLMHNGTFSGLHDKVKSDTELFNECAQEYLKTKNPEEVDELIRTEINSCVNSGNKVLFMNGEGGTFISGEDRGVWISGVWYSNFYSFYATKNLRTNKEITMSIVYGSAIQRRVSIHHPSVQANFNTAIGQLPLPKKAIKPNNQKIGSNKSTLPPPRTNSVHKYAIEKSRWNDESFEFNFGLFDSNPPDTQSESVLEELGMSTENIVFDEDTDDSEEVVNKGVYLHSDYNETQKFLQDQRVNAPNRITRSRDDVCESCNPRLNIFCSEEHKGRFKRILDAYHGLTSLGTVTKLSKRELKRKRRAERKAARTNFGRQVTTLERQDGRVVKHVVYNGKREV